MRTGDVHEVHSGDTGHGGDGARVQVTRTMWHGHLGADRADREHRAFGVVTLVLGVLALASTGWLWLLATTDVVTPPDWLHAAGSVWLAVGAAGALVVGIGTVARPGPGRRLGSVGLALAAAAAVLFALLVLTAP